MAGACLAVSHRNNDASDKQLNVCMTLARFHGFGCYPSPRGHSFSVLWVSVSGRLFFELVEDVGVENALSLSPSLPPFTLFHSTSCHASIVC